MKDLLPRLRAQLASMMNVQDTALGKDGVEYMEDVFHRPGVILVPRVKLRERIHNHECWLQVGHDLYQVGHIIRLIDDIEA